MDGEGKMVGPTFVSNSLCKKPSVSGHNICIKVGDNNNTGS